MRAATHNKKGFSLLEVLVAIFVLVIGVVGAMNLINYSLSSVAVGKSRIIAVELAQEGLEIVRNIRDSNWIEDVSWTDGLGAGDWRVQYNDPGLVAFASTPLQINNGGFYGYNGIAGFSGGTNTFFYRKITITNMSASEIRAVSEITWNERGKPYVVNAEDRLFNWK